MNAYLKEITEDEFEDILNVTHGTVEVCGMPFDSGTIYRELDPIAFDSDRLYWDSDDWICGNCGERFDSEDDANECCNECEYICKKCKSEHDNQDDANECCKE